MQLILSGAKSRAQVLGLFVGSIWLVSVLGFVFPIKHSLGVEPRSLLGLVGIVTAPWAHGGLGHLVSNTVPLLVLGWLAMLPKQEGFWQALAGGMLGAGAAAWLLGGAHTVHIGASGVVFGLFGFILARGYYTRRLVDIAVALPAGALYGFSMLLGLLPVYPGVSWQSHLGGAIGGVLAARYFTRMK
jgi:membrane associated rhomboid family serine protease